MNEKNCRCRKLPAVFLYAHGHPEEIGQRKGVHIVVHWEKVGVKRCWKR